MMRKSVFIAILVLFCLIAVSCSQMTVSTEETAPVQSMPTAETMEAIPKIEVPSGSDDYYHKNYKAVVDELKNAGFESVEISEVADLTSSDIDRDDCVEQITINGSSFFSRGTAFPAESEVVIVYHSIPKLKLPLGSSETLSMSQKDIEEAFKNAGFKEILSKTLADIDPDKTSEKIKNEVTVGSKADFVNGNTVPFDSIVEIVTHIPFEKYTVTLDIQFPGNLLFSRYDVEFYVNDEKTEVLPHGKDKTVTFRLPKCEAVLLFKSATTDAKGEIKLKVESDIVAQYKISCSSLSVSIDEVFVDRMIEIPEDQVKMQLFSKDYVSKKYRTAEDELRKLGFTNITSKPVYNLSSGDSRREDVSEISIDGNTSFRRGDLFKKSAPVVITYRLERSEDPTATTKTPSTTKAPATTNNTPSTTKAATTTAEETLSYYSKTLFYAKDGDSGVYAYYDKAKSYQIYYIINFDEGYVYRFTMNNDESWCERFIIEGSNLNDGIVVTYHDGDMTWTNTLKFKKAQKPENLVLTEHDGHKKDFYSTDLKTALRYLNTKDIKDA